jgi:hypothetical protein
MGPVWVIATRFTFTTTMAAAAAGPHSLRFWATWGTVPGAIGLSVRYQPRLRVAWTLSVWSRESDLDAFLGSPAHRALVGGFHDRLTGTSTGWESTDFDPGQGWRRAVEALTPTAAPPRGR